jgi:hypothetical protein
VTHDITEYDENKHLGDMHVEEDSAPLCLVHYYAERAAYPPERNPKPPGDRLIRRVAERRGNLIILEFAAPPAPKPARTEWPGGRGGKGLPARAYDALMLSLLLACLLGCLAAFRF